MTSVVGGRFAVVEGIPAVRNWGINHNGTLAPFVNSATQIGHGRLDGITAWNGQYLGHGALPTVMPNDYFAFEGYTGPASGILEGAGAKYAGNAYVSGIMVNWNWAQGSVLEHQVTFEGDLDITKTDSGYSDDDASVSNPEPVQPCHIDYSANGTDWTQLPSCTQASLQILAAIQSYVNSDTAGKTGRKPGIIDANASISVEESILGGGLTRGSLYQFRFYTTATYFWLLKWMRVKEFTGLQANAETGAIVAHSISLEMAGTSGSTIGAIKTPGASPTTIWGT